MLTGLGAVLDIFLFGACDVGLKEMNYLRYTFSWIYGMRSNWLRYWHNYFSLTYAVVFCPKVENLGGTSGR
jgi:hypothetical protein